MLYYLVKQTPIESLFYLQMIIFIV